MNITQQRLSENPERTVYYIDVGNMPIKEAEIYLEKMMGRYVVKEPSLLVKVMELIGSSGFGLQF